MNIFLICLVCIVILIIIYVIALYNKLISLRNKVKDQFSQIDVQLKRRFDLIPNLVETVKGYTTHESETLENIISARNSYINAKDAGEKIEASKSLESFTHKLFALAEAYPDLKANTNFLSLQNDLKEIEEKIAYARQFYNDSVLMYNNKVEMFPTNLVASIFGFKKENFFNALDNERENVKVSF